MAILARTSNLVERDANNNYSQKKILGFIPIQTTIDALEEGDKDVTYLLESVVLHLGPHMHRGHYVCVRRKALSEGWLLCNDEEVSELAALTDVLSHEQNAYLLFYRRTN